jgi:ABC-type spermidine/putrescine transport system permease subunit II/DNA-binding beta-propeller fold protein YncE
VSPTLFRQQLGRTWFWTCGLLTVGLCLVATGLPLFQILSVKRSWTELPGALAANHAATWNSFWYAIAAATVVTGLGVLRAIWGPLPSGEKRAFPCRVLFWLPLLVPGVVLGLFLIYVLNRPWSWFLYRSSAVVILAFVIRYFALGWNTVLESSRGADRDLLDDARSNGANAWQIMRFALWPQISHQVTGAAYVIFLLCLWDVESMILVWPPGGETLPLVVFNLLHYGHNAQVNALCLTLLVLAVAPLLAWKLFALVRTHRLLRASRIFLPVLVSSCGLLAVAGCSGQDSGKETSLNGSHLFSSVQVIGRRGVGVGELNKPRSVAVDSQDNLYVVDMTGRVQKFLPNGTFSISWQLPQTDLGKPKGMTRDTDGNIVVIEPHYQRINHFAKDGTLLAQWGVKGTNAGQFTLPRAVAVNSHGEIYISEYAAAERVQRFRILAEPTGAARSSPKPLLEGKAKQEVVVEFVNSFGIAGTAPGDFNRPEGLCVDTKDQIHVADSCNHRIQIFSREGRFVRAYGKAGRQKGELSYPYDICVDTAGRQYVCEFGNSRIQVFDANDRPIEIIGGPGSEPGQFSNPWGVALDSEGNLYVADSQNHRVQKLIRDEKAQPKPGKLTKTGMMHPVLNKS